MIKKICRKYIQELKQVNKIFEIQDGYLNSIPYDFSERIPECVKKLSTWRIENPSLSPARFPVSDERTEKWLNTAILNNPDRVLFMIQAPEKQCIGHIGISIIDYEKEIIRIDSVLKGVKSECPGIMKKAVSFLIGWCFEILGAQVVDLVVLDDNVRAIKLYLDCGFQVDKKIPLKRIDERNEVNWVEDETLNEAEKYYLHMKVCR